MGIKTGHMSQRSFSVSRLEQNCSGIRARAVIRCPRFLIVRVSDIHMVYFANDMRFRLIDMGQKELALEYNTQQRRILEGRHFHHSCDFFIRGPIIVLDPTREDKSIWIRLADHVARRR